MKCPQCGKEIANDSQFCEYCGAQINSQFEKPMMSFGEAISSCFNKYATFSGRATRAEYWWWALFSLIVGIVAALIPYVGFLISLAIFLPGLSVAVRRCHDTNHSGWWILCPIYNIVLMFLPSEPGTNEYDEVAA